MTLSAFGCNVLSVLHKGPRSTLYRARRESDGLAVVIKTLTENSGSGRASSLHRERTVLQRLAHSRGVIEAHGLVRDGHRWALLLQDFPGSNLAQQRLAGALTVAEFVELAVRLVDMVAQVHDRHVVHRDVSPTNILFDPGSGQLKLVDFGRASVLAEDTVQTIGFDGLERTLPYCSPELTGRVNRSVDSRADYYSLGVTMFELLTGVVPFNAAEPLSVVHGHIARLPQSPKTLRPAVPEALCQVVLKLLAKEPEERYQSAERLRADLERCGRELSAGRTEFSFELAVGDSSQEFRLPQKLYSRELELEQLSSSYDACRGGKCVVLCLSGEAGIGKSALLRELLKVVTMCQGHFALGKFEQFQGGAPNAAVVQVLDALAMQLLAESSTRLAEFRERCAHAERTPALLLELCPALVKVLGQPPSVAQLAPAERRNRLHEEVGAFLAALATPERPLCIAFDDMQWAAADSLRTIEEVVLSRRRVPMLVVVSAREVAPEDRLCKFLERLAAAGLRVDRLHLNALSPDAVRAFVANAMSCPEAEAAPLARAAWTRTRGNPYFLREFFTSLQADGLLTRLPGGFGADLKRILQRGVAENLVQLLLDRIASLPSASQELIRYAACLGNRFEVRTLCAVADTDGAALWALIAAELIVPFGAVSSVADLTLAEAGSECRFAHDRVQQAALATLDDMGLRRLRLQVGRRLIPLASSGSNTHLFEIVANMNAATALIETAEERALVAKLNLEAARLALLRAGGVEAISLVQHGIAALGAAGWETSYDVIRDLHLTGVEAAFAWSDHEALSSLASSLKSRARDPLDAVRCQRLEGRVHQAQTRLTQALQSYIGGLAQLGMDLPAAADPEHIRKELELTRTALQGLDLEARLSRPICGDPAVVVCAELLSSLLFASYSAGNPLLVVAICRLVRLAVTNDNVPEAASGYLFYGELLARDGDLAGATRFAQLAVDIAHLFENPALLSQTYLFANYQLLHWRVPLCDLADSFRKAYQYGLEAGSPRNASCSATTLCICRFWAGDELGALQQQILEYREVIASFRQTLVLNWHEILAQMVDNLRSNVADPTSLRGELYDVATRMRVHKAEGDQSALFNLYLAKGFLCYLFGKYRAGLSWIERARSFEQIRTALWAAPLALLDSLCCLAVSETVETSQQMALQARVSANIEQLRGWLAQNPQSVEPKLRLVEAELYRVRNDIAAARMAYAQAVESATQGTCLHEEAIAAELAGRFCASVGDVKGARTYLRAAHRAYSRWGAVSKVRDLERQHPRFLPQGDAASSGHAIDLHPLDAILLVNASRTMSSEIKAERIVPQMMRFLVEGGGAQAGYLLLKRDDDWVVEASEAGALGESVPLNTRSLKELELEGSLGPPVSIVHYVARSGEQVLLDDARRSDRFARDPRIAAGAVISVLCFPLKRQTETLGIVYLENNLTRGAFTEDRVKVLEMLSGQAMVSLENARLYDVLEQKVAARTRELSVRNVELASALERVLDMQRQLVMQEKLAALGALTAGIAHEIKNPLNFVMNFAHLSTELTTDMFQLLEPALATLEPEQRENVHQIGDELRENMDKIHEHGRRAVGIVNGMALHAREGTGRRELADLNGVVHQCVHLLSQTPKGRNEALQIKTLLDANIGPLELNVSDLSRVFVNLIANARYAVEARRHVAGAAFTPNIEVCTLDCGDTVEVRVRDNGFGVPAALLERIFEPFFTTKPAGDGTGLGLSVSQEIVRAHAGDLLVNSREGEYAEFIVSLPKRQNVASSSLRLR